MQVVGKSVNTISGYGGDGKSIKNIGLLSQSTFVQVQKYARHHIRNNNGV